MKIFNFKFPDKSGFTLRYNPASGISAALEPAKVARVSYSPFSHRPELFVNMIMNSDFSRVFAIILRGARDR
jgi:hypothetical protein